MSWVINNLRAPDAYTLASTLDGLPSVRRATLDVSNQAVFIQVKRITIPGASWTMASWESEELVLPGSKSILRAGLVGIRFRAVTPAAQIPAGSVQAQVTLVVP